MSIKQLTVFVENKPGTLVTITDTLAANNVNIRALSLAETQDFGVLRMIVNDLEVASRTLSEQGFLIKTTEVIGVKIGDDPGKLTAALQVLKDAGINMEYLYAFTHEKTEKAILLLQAEDLDNLINILTAYKIPLVPAEEVYNL